VYGTNWCVVDDDTLSLWYHMVLQNTGHGQNTPPGIEVHRCLVLLLQVVVGIYTTLHQKQQHGHGQNCDVLNAKCPLLLLHLFLCRCSASASVEGQVMFAFQSSLLHLPFHLSCSCYMNASFVPLLLFCGFS
jgi:hypothetical protein